MSSKLLPRIVYPKLISPYTIHKYPEFLKFLDKSNQNLYINPNTKKIIENSNQNLYIDPDTKKIIETPKNIQKEISMGMDSKMMYCLEINN